MAVVLKIFFSFSKKYGKDLSLEKVTFFGVMVMVNVSGWGQAVGF